MALILYYDGIYDGQKCLPILGSADNNRFYLGTGNLQDLEEPCFVISSSIDTQDDALYVDGNIIPNDRMVIVFTDLDPLNDGFFILNSVTHNGNTYDIESEYFKLEDIQAYTQESTMHFYYPEDGDREIIYYVLIEKGKEQEVMEISFLAKFVMVFHESRQVLFGKTRLSEAWNVFTARVRRYLTELNPRYPDLLLLAWERLPEDVRAFFDEQKSDIEKMLNIPGLAEKVKGQFPNPDALQIVNPIPPNPEEMVFGLRPLGGYIGLSDSSTDPNLNQDILKMINILDELANSNPYPQFDEELLLTYHIIDVGKREAGE